MESTMKVRILTGIASVERVLQVDDVVDMPEKMARAYAAEGAVEIVGKAEAKAPEVEPELKAEPGTRRISRKPKAE
jgi:hypothetical protein